MNEGQDLRSNELFNNPAKAAWSAGKPAKRSHAITQPFSSSKEECMAWLDSIARRLNKEDETAAQWLTSYERQLFNQLDQEGLKLRNQLCRLLDESLAENKKKLKQMYSSFGRQQRQHIEEGKFRLNLLKCRIDELRRELTSEHYKQGIIEVLSHDLVAELTAATNDIQHALSNFQEHVYLKVNANILDRFGKEATQLFFVEQAGNVRRNSPQQNPVNAPPKPNRFTFEQFGSSPRFQHPMVPELVVMPNFGSASQIESRPTSVQIPGVNRSAGGTPLSRFHPSRMVGASQRGSFHQNRDVILSGRTSSPSRN